MCLSGKCGGTAGGCATSRLVAAAGRGGGESGCAPFEVPGIVSTDLEDHVLAALVNLCPENGRTQTSWRPSASPAKRGRLFGGFSEDEHDADIQWRRPGYLGGTVSPGADGNLHELSRTGVEVVGSVPRLPG